MVTAALYESVVEHNRLQPWRYRLRSRTYYWFVDIDDLPRVPWWARPLAGFPRDIRNQAELTSARVMMLTQARVLGYVFNPLTVYWCFDADGALETVVAEVHNTYGASHRYVLRPEGGVLHTPKKFYVSPFFKVEGEYEMRMPVPDERLQLLISLAHPGGRQFTASLRGRRKPATTINLLRLALRYPLSTLMVTARIRYHGIRLYLRGLPVIPRHQEGTP